MKTAIYPIGALVLTFVAIVFIDRININSLQNAQQVVQSKLSVFEDNIVEYASKYKEVLMIERPDKSSVYALSGWGIQDIQEIFRKRVIVNNTGWYWIIRKGEKIFVVKLKYRYPVNNQWLEEHYAECVGIPDGYKLEYQEGAKVFRMSDQSFLPFRLLEYPKYKNKWVVDINVVLFIVWWWWVCSLLIRTIRYKWWQWVVFVLILLGRGVLYEYDVIRLLNDSFLYDVRVFAFPQVFVFRSLGDVLMTVGMYVLFSRVVLKGKSTFEKWLIVVLGIFLLWMCVYLFMRHAGFTLYIPDILFYDYEYWGYSVGTIVFILVLIMFLSFVVVKQFLRSDSFYHSGIVALALLSMNVLSVFYYQKINLKDKVNYIFDWIENEEQLALFEQLQKTDNVLKGLHTHSDSVYFKMIESIENSSVYIQLSKRYLFEDSTSVINFLRDKKMIWKNVYVDNVPSSFYEGAPIVMLSIYYLNKIDKRYLLSVFDYTSPFSNQLYYPFLSDKLFQLPSGFKNFHIAVYEKQYLKYQFGDFSFPSQQNRLLMYEQFFSDYQFSHRKVSHQFIVVAYPKMSAMQYLTLLSIYFIILISLLLLGLYLFYVWQTRHLFPVYRIRYTYKITGLVMFILVISFYLLFIFSYRHIYRISEKNIRSELLHKASSVRVDASDSKEFFTYSEDGYLLSRYASDVLWRFKLIPSYLPAKWLAHLKEKKFLFVKRNIGRYTYTSLLMSYSADQKLYMAELPFFNESAYKENTLYKFLSPLFNVYALLFLLSFLLGILLSDYIVSPIRNIAKVLRENDSPLSLKVIEYTASDELGELVSNYNALVARLNTALERLKKEEQEKAWKLMAQQVAHDIKNSLTPLLLNIEYLQKQENMAAHYQKILRLISEQVRLLARIAEDFSEFAIDIQPKKELVYLISLIENCVHTYDQYKALDIRILNDLRKDVRIYSDAHLLSRILLNILRNAAESMEFQGAIEICLSEKKEGILLSVKDNGPGIPKEIQDKIFEPKFSTKTSGKGLGLSIVKNISDALGIRVYFESVENQGTTFYLEFKEVQAEV